MKKNLHSSDKNKLIQKRPSADKTRNTILRVATQLFAKKGFSGTSIRDIAQAAKINQNLICHHYGSKENLWNRVRLDIADKFKKSCGLDAIQQSKTLKSFLEVLVKNLFSFWLENIDMLRILNWQRLEANQKSLKIIRSTYSLYLQEAIVTLQKQGQIRQDVHADIILLLIFSATHGALEESSVIFQKNKAQKQKEYLQLVLDSLYKALKV